VGSNQRVSGLSRCSEPIHVEEFARYVGLDDDEAWQMLRALKPSAWRRATPETQNYLSSHSTPS
jgi:hypothetical protein